MLSESEPLSLETDAAVPFVFRHRSPHAGWKLPRDTPTREPYLRKRRGEKRDNGDRLKRGAKTAGRKGGREEEKKKRRKEEGRKEEASSGA